MLAFSLTICGAGSLYGFICNLDVTFGFDSCLCQGYRIANRAMLAFSLTICGAGSRYGFICDLDVTGLCQQLCLDGHFTYRADLVFGAIFGAVCFLIDDPLAVSMTEGARYSFTTI
jgi:hypothetical protein